MQGQGRHVRQGRGGCMWLNAARERQSAGQPCHPNGCPSPTQSSFQTHQPFLHPLVPARAPLHTAWPAAPGAACARKRIRGRQAGLPGIRGRGAPGAGGAGWPQSRPRCTHSCSSPAAGRLGERGGGRESQGGVGGSKPRTCAHVMLRMGCTHAAACAVHAPVCCAVLYIACTRCLCLCCAAGHAPACQTWR